MYLLLISALRSYAGTFYTSVYVTPEYGPHMLDNIIPRT